MRERDLGTYILPCRLTVANFLDKWLESVKPNVRTRTYEGYESIVRVHVSPSLGTVPLDKLRPMHLQTYYSEQQAHGGYKQKPLSALTVHHHHRLLHEALSQAVRWQVLPTNPAEAVTPPRFESRRPTIMDEDETAKFLEQVKASGGILYLPILLESATGLRRSELLALTWDSIDWKAGALAVSRGLHKTKAGLVFEEPETNLSRRTVSLPPFALKILRQHRKDQLELKMSLGGAYQDHNLICCRPDGRPWEPARFSADFGDLMQKLGRAGLRFHDLRHVHASHLLRRGLDIQSTSARLGHSTSTTTLSIYSHTLQDADAAAARMLERTLGKAVRKAQDASV